MRVALVAPPWGAVPPPSYGGTEAVVDLLARHLQLAGHDVLLCTSGDSTCDVPRAVTRPCAAGIVTGGVEAVSVALAHVVSSYRYLLEWGADVVHDHTLAGPLYGDRFGIPVVTTCHGRFDASTNELFAHLGDGVAVTAISRHQAASAPEVRVAAVIHHGIETETFPAGAGDGGYAAFLGRMNPDKGVAIAVRAARAAGLPLRIAARMGEPGECAYFHDEVEPLLGPDVEFVGEVGPEDKRTLLAGATCLVNPLRWPEPFGLVMIEALACGTPVVALDAGSVPEVVDDGVTGFVCGDERELTDALGRVSMLDRDRCRAVARTRFSAARMAAEYADLYASLLGEREELCSA